MIVYLMWSVEASVTATTSLYPGACLIARALAFWMFFQAWRATFGVDIKRAIWMRPEFGMKLIGGGGSERKIEAFLLFACECGRAVDTEKVSRSVF